MNYLWLTVRHKWFVLIAGRWLRVPLWRLIIHDWTKFLLCELPHYQRQFFGKADQPEKFIRAWTHHQNSNTHHWEYWIPRSGYNRCDPPYPDNESIPMPRWAVREMVANWLAAGRAYEGKWPNSQHWDWLKKHLPNIQYRLHWRTRMYLNDALNELGVSEEWLKDQQDKNGFGD